MGFLDWLGGQRYNKKSLEINDSQVLRIVYNGNFGGYKPLFYFQEDTNTYIEKGYLGNHVVFTIADWVGRKAATVQPILYKVKSQSALKKYQSYQKSFDPKNVVRMNQLKKKAFELVEIEEHPLLDVLKKPNPTQSWDDFIYGYFIYRKFTGVTYIKGSKADNSTRTKGFQEIYLLPSQYIEAVSAGAGNILIDHYTDSRTPTEKLKTDEVCAIRTFSPKDSGLNGTSLFKSASKLLTKTSDSLDAETETMQNRGAKKIVFPNLTPAELANLPLPSDEQASEMSETIRKRISEAGNNGIAINSVPLGSIELGLSPVDLNILESKSYDDKAWCSLFHVSSMVVLNDHESASYDTMQQNMLLSVTNGIIPDLEALKLNLNEWLVKSHDPTLYLDFDYTEFPEMQAEFFKVAKQLKDLESFTTDEIRELLKYGAYDGENGNKILVGGGKKILDDITFDVPQVNSTNLNL